MQFRAETFNLCNHPIFGERSEYGPTSANFGKILRNNGQTNFARQVQLGVRFASLRKDPMEIDRREFIVLPGPPWRGSLLAAAPPCPGIRKSAASAR